MTVGQVECDHNVEFSVEQRLVSVVGDHLLREAVR